MKNLTRERGTLNNKHCIEEVESVQAELNKLRNRNILFKEQLSDALSREVGPDFVEKAEWYQQCFLETDQVIDILRHDLNMLLNKLKLDNPTADEEIQCGQLKTDVKKLARSIIGISRSFRTFLKQDSVN